jgi:hypothetical protein
MHPVEKLRRIWTPGREIEEVVARLDPQTELDSMVRHFFTAIVQELGSVKLDLGSEANPRLNTGTIRWEIVHGPAPEERPDLRNREVTIWHEP